MPIVDAELEAAKDEGEGEDADEDAPSGVAADAPSDAAADALSDAAADAPSDAAAAAPSPALAGGSAVRASAGRVTIFAEWAQAHPNFGAEELAALGGPDAPSRMQLLAGSKAPRPPPPRAAPAQVMTAHQGGLVMRGVRHAVWRGDLSPLLRSLTAAQLASVEATADQHGYTAGCTMASRLVSAARIPFDVSTAAHAALGVAQMADLAARTRAARMGGVATFETDPRGNDAYRLPGSSEYWRVVNAAPAAPAYTVEQIQQMHLEAVEADADAALVRAPAWATPRFADLRVPGPCSYDTAFSTFDGAGVREMLAPLRADAAGDAGLRARLAAVEAALARVDETEHELLGWQLHVKRPYAQRPGDYECGVPGCESGAMGYDEVVTHGLFAHPELHRDVPPEAGIGDEPPPAARQRAIGVKDAVLLASQHESGAVPPEAGIGDKPPSVNQ